MTGGKSSSSSSSSNETTTSSASTTGNTGNVIQGGTVTVNDQLPDSAVNVFQQLVSLANQSITVAANAGQSALDVVNKNTSANLAATNNLAQATKQPDLTVLQGSQQQIYYAIGAIALVAIVIFLRKK